MDEQQMIDDILDSVYGFDIFLKEGDSKTIALKKKEREEKHGEILLQINSICASIEKELKNILGTDYTEMKKYIRATVLNSIKTEIENGNKVIDSNGKINTGKLLEIVNQSKEEILEKIEVENNSLVDMPRENNDENSSQNDNKASNLNDFFEEMDSFGVEFTEEDKDAVRRAVDRANEVLKCINEKVESGMTEDEAWEDFFEGMSPDEIKELEMQFALADVASNFVRKKNDDREDIIPEEKEVESVAEEGSSVQKEDKRGVCENYRSMAIRTHEFFERINNVNTEAKTDNKFTVGSDFQQLGVTMQKIMTNCEVSEHFQSNYPVEMYFSYRDTTFSSDVGIESGEKINEFFVQNTFVPQQDVLVVQDATISDEEHSQSENEHRITQLSGNEGAPTFIITPIDTRFENKKEGKEKKIPEESMDGLLAKYGVDMAVATFDLRNPTVSDLKSKRTEKTPSISGAVEMQEALNNFSFQETYVESFPTSTSIVEEITVDESAVTQEGQNEPSKKGTLSAKQIMELVANQAEVRKILEASGIIHGQMPGIPTTEKNANQEVSVADNGDKGEEGPGEL